MGSRDLNKIMITGRLGRDAELRVTPTNGAPVCNFSVASSRSVKVGEEWREQTEWFRVVSWNKLAERVGKMCVKGTHVYVEGRLQSREYQDANGNPRTSVEVIADDVLILGGGAKGEGELTGDFAEPEAPRPAGNANGRRNGPPQYANIEDIPF
jgi:single-strand DNA-binding protein